MSKLDENKTLLKKTISIKRADTYSNVLMLLLGSFILMLFALYNGAPMISGDTEVYLKSGFEGVAAAERPIFYGLFVRFTSLGLSIWFTIFAQALIVSFLLHKIIKHFIPDIKMRHEVALLLIISLGTICSWYVGSLMPDIFTPILGLCLFCFLFCNNNKFQQIILIFLLFLATLVHFSHYLILTTSVVLLFLIIVVRPKYRKLWFKKWVFITIICTASWFSLMTSNFLANRGFVTSTSSNVFLMGKLCESGVLQTYLEKACPIKNYKICQYKDSLPSAAWEFVWNPRFNPTGDSLGWEANKAENTAIMKDIMSRPKYLLFILYKSIEATARQSILTNIDEGEERPWIKYDETDPVFKEIKKHFPHEFGLFKSARQNTKILNYVFYDEVFIIVFIVSLLMLLFIVRDKQWEEFLPYFLYVILYVCLNGFVTATFGNVLSRLNSRNIWILPTFNIIVLFYIYNLKSNKNEKIN
jgi:hypothetical protein